MFARFLRHNSMEDNIAVVVGTRIFVTTVNLKAIDIPVRPR